MAELVQVGVQTRSPAALLNAAAVDGKLLALMRQFGVLVGIAAAVALGTWVVLWSQTPGYSLLYGNLSERDITQVMEALQNASVKYHVDQGSGAIMVPSAQVHEVRLKLAAAGLPQSTSTGFEVLQEQSGFGTSQFMETVRYQHALEAELARTVGQMYGVRTARVHLAMPKQSAFLRDRKPPSASVLLELHPGRTLEKGQVSAIAHLVAAAVPNLPLSGVTVVDQRGSLLSDKEDLSGLALTERQLSFTRALEERHVRAITGLLERIAGPDAVHVQVAADLDFTMSEQTSESYNPDLAALRSEQTTEEHRVGAGAMGVPGALSNQPPAAAQVPETTAATPPADPAAPAPADAAAATAAPATAAPAAAAVATERTPENSRTQQVRNYEVDRTIAHTTSAVGQLRRLSVAVLVKNRSQTDAQGVTTAQPWSPEELANFETLARRAVGFDEARGDTLSITTADLVGPAVIEPLPPLPLWEQAWLWDTGRQFAGASFALLVLFGILKPAVKSLTERRDPAGTGQIAGPMTQIAGEEGHLTILRLPDGRSVTVDLTGLDQGGVTQVVAVPRSDSRAMVATGAGDAPRQDTAVEGGDPGLLDELERDLHKVREMVQQDPRLAALIMRRWVESAE